LQYNTPQEKIWDALHLTKEDSIKYVVAEFTNVSEVKWNTKSKFFLIFIDVTEKKSNISENGKTCQLQIKGDPKADEFNKLTFISAHSFWHRYHMASINPFLSEASHRLFNHFTKPLDRTTRRLGFSHAQVPHVYSHFVINQSSTWLQAQHECQELGGNLYSLDSYEQWYILMENSKYIFDDIHYMFWLSPIIF